MESYCNDSFDISYNYCKFGRTLYTLYSLESDNKYSVIDKWSLFIEKRHRIYKALERTFYILGLCFEPFQGGIKKDPATFGYLFLTSGLAFMALLLLNVICDYFRCVKSTRFLVMPGQNPMMAYVVGDLFNENAWMGFLRGVVLTTL